MGKKKWRYDGICGVIGYGYTSKEAQTDYMKRLFLYRNKDGSPAIKSGDINMEIISMADELYKDEFDSDCIKESKYLCKCGDPQCAGFYLLHVKEVKKAIPIITQQEEDNHPNDIVTLRMVDDPGDPGLFKRCHIIITEKPVAYLTHHDDKKEKRYSHEVSCRITDSIMSILLKDEINSTDIVDLTGYGEDIDQARANFEFKFEQLLNKLNLLSEQLNTNKIDIKEV